MKKKAVKPYIILAFVFALLAIAGSALSLMFEDKDQKALFNILSLSFLVLTMIFIIIYLMVRKDLHLSWNFIKDEEKSSPITLEEAIGWLPSLDPYIQGYSLEKVISYFPDFEKKKAEGLKISKWHFPPTHKIRHIEVMRYTPEGLSALENDVHYPRNSDGSKVKGYSNTYKRQWWNKPGYTVTTYNGAVCSQDNVHPGHPAGIDSNGEKVYSDPRVLSIFEIMIVMSLPRDWPIPDWANETLIRKVIGEGVPSKLIKVIMEELLKQI